MNGLKGRNTTKWDFSLELVLQRVLEGKRGFHTFTYMALMSSMTEADQACYNVKPQDKRLGGGEWLDVY